MRKLFIALLVVFGLSLAYSPAASAAGAIFGDNDVCGKAGGAAGCTNGQGSPVNLVLNRAVDLAATIGGIIVVIFVVVGGFQYITSAGDPSKAEAARNTIIYALIGGLVIAVARGIVTFVVSRLNP